MPHLEAAVRSLFNSTKYPFELLLIESESTDGTKEFCDNLAKQFEQVKVFHTKKEGLTKAINKGIKESKGDVYITQDDVIHFKLYGVDWLAEMANAGKKETTGVICGLAAGGVSGPDYLEGLRWVGTWNLYLPRHTIKKVGLFDEKMGPGDDIDYCYRIKKAGLRLVILPFWVQHHRLTEHFGDDKDLQDKMAQYFRKKHNI